VDCGKMAAKKTERIWEQSISFIMIGLALLTLYPLIYVLSTSISHVSFVKRGLVYLWPKGINLASWEYILGLKTVLRPVVVTTVVTIVGTTWCMLVTILLAYPTAKSGFSLTKIISIGVVFTMILKPPMIPYFLTLRAYGLINNPLVLILPHTVIAYNYFVIRTFFKQVPNSLEESALVDGANYYQILFSIIVPVSKAALATIGLFYGVLCWNQFYHPKLFIHSERFVTVQLYLRQILDRANNLDTVQSLASTLDAKYGPETLNAAAVIFMTLPIISVYPFLQKYFVKGAMLGAIKG